MHTVMASSFASALLAAASLLVMPTAAAAESSDPATSPPAPPPAAPPATPSGPVEPPDPVEFVLDRADSLRHAGKVDMAEAMLDSALSERRAAQDAHAEARLVFGQGNLLRRTNRAKEAEAVLAEAARRAEAVADSNLWCLALMRQAQSADAQGRPPRSIPIYERLIEVAEAARLDRFVSRGEVYLARRDIGAGQLEVAERRLQRAMELNEQSDHELDRATAIFFMGLCQQRLGRPESARRYWEDALQSAEAAGNASLAGNTLNNLGIIEMTRGQPERAAAHWERAVELARSKNRLRAGMTPAANAARAYLELGRDEDAERMLQESLEITQRYGFSDHEANARINLGEIYRWRRQPAQAAAEYRRALHLLSETDLPQYELTATVGLAQALAEQDSAATSLVILETCHEELGPRLGLEKQLVLQKELAEFRIVAGRPETAIALLENVVAKAGEQDLDWPRLEGQHLMAVARRALGQPDRALVWLDRATTTWEETRSLPDDPAWREQRGVLGAKIYGETADLLLESPAELTAAQRRRQAFDFLQRFKNRTLLERVAAPSEVVETRDRETLVDLARLQALLTKGELLLDFYVAPKRTLLFAVTADSCRALRLDGSESDLGHRLVLLSELLSSPAAGETSDVPLYGEALKTLAVELLDPISDLLNESGRIIYVPDGGLHRMPLSPLLWALSQRADSGREPGPGELATLDVHRVPSATFLAFLRESGRSSPAPGTTMLAFASTRPRDGRELAGARHEVESLDARYADVELRLAEDDAQPLRAADLEPFDVVHLAGHIRLDEQRPWRSGILVGPVGAETEPATAENTEDTDPLRDAAPSAATIDSMLRAETIATSRLSAHLAVLSGCESAGGRVLSGEGLLGLSSAFLSAGVPCVVATLWPVDDAVTARFMERFYRELAGGSSIDASLARARDALRSRPESAHPFHWAAFTAIGAGEMELPLTTRTIFDVPSAWMILLACAIVVALTIVFVIRRGGRDPSTLRKAVDG